MRCVLGARVHIRVRLRSVARAQARMLEAPSALDQDDLREDGERDLARALVSEAQPDRGVEPLVLAGIAPRPPRDVAQDERDLAAAADEAHVSRPGGERG